MGHDDFDVGPFPFLFLPDHLAFEERRFQKFVQARTYWSICDRMTESR